ncbi:hypothetical protein LXA43DRAFT_82150 [Ganoderma leucocontextum]|nr:hypothetical protein LXA43DRAFT_82150 [Ganoderma leucocontextum]
MFSSSVQPGLVSLFSSTGSEPLGLFASHTDSTSRTYFCSTTRPPNLRLRLGHSSGRLDRRMTRLSELRFRPDRAAYSVANVAHDVRTMSARASRRLGQGKRPTSGAETLVDPSASAGYGEGVGL